MKTKISLIALVAITVSACGGSKDVALKTSNEPVAVTENIKVPETPKAPAPAPDPRMKGHLMGRINKEMLQSENYPWFTSNYEEYTVDADYAQKLMPLLDDVEIKVYMGTWCGDSKREIPRLYAILDAAEFDYDALNIVAVDRSKQEPRDMTRNMQIKRVPTIIFYKQGKELNRIVEYPRESLEADMFAILTEQPYKHSYQD